MKILTMFLCSLKKRIHPPAPTPLSVALEQLNEAKMALQGLEILQLSTQIRLESECNANQLYKSRIKRLAVQVEALQSL